MSKLNDLIQKYCPNGVEYFKMSEIGTHYSGLSGKSKTDFENGNCKYITYTNIYNNPATNLDVDDYVKVNSNEKQNVIKYKDILIAGSSENLEDSGMISVVTIQPNENIYLNSFCFGFRLNDDFYEKYEPEFLKYLFRGESFRKKIKSCSSGVTRYNLSKEKFLKIIVPCPPIEVQREIASILDNLSYQNKELEECLNKELEARKIQYRYWKEKLFELENCEWKTTNEVFDVITDYVSNGSFKSIADNVSYKNEKDYAVLVRTVDYSNKFDENKFIYIDEHAYNFLEKSKLFGGEIIINNIGAGVGTTFLCPNLGMPMSLAPNSVMMRTPNNKFYYYWFNSKKGKDSIDSVTTKSSMPKFNKTGFRTLLVPVPKREKQDEIVNKLDKLEESINAIIDLIPSEISERNKQYSYYRDKLLSFKELEI